MKVMFASTPEQEEKIQELVRRFYTNIFPRYFSDDEIKQFESLKILHTSTRHFEYFGTLKEAYQVITSLHTLISILETEESIELEQYEDMFDHNVSILRQFDIFFPFSIEQFMNMKAPMLSIYTKADNELLV